MPRFLHIRGLQGVPVADPRAPDASPPRFAGQRRRATPPTDPAANLVDFYEPIADVVPDSPHLRAAVKAKELELLGDIVTARDIDAARAVVAKRGPVAATPSPPTATPDAKEPA